ncbi:MAG: isochorismate synthase [Bacteroidetes bacterium]|nr:isochorismate synthase [Bacteroidota bacterium]
MRNTTRPRNLSTLNVSSKPDQASAIPVSSTWTVITLDWDVESIMQRLHIRSDDQTNARFAWKAPDSQTSQGEEFIALGRQQALKATGERRFQDLAHAERILQTSTHFIDLRANRQQAVPFIVGGAAFHHFNIDPAWSAFGSSQFILPHLLLGTDSTGKGYIRFVLPSQEARSWLDHLHPIESRSSQSFLQDRLNDVIDSEGAASDVVDTQSYPISDIETLGHRLNNAASQTKEIWISRFQRAIDAIQQSPLKKVVLARQASVHGVTVGERAQLQQSLHQRYRNCIHFCVEPTSDSGFFGATPERLLRLQGRNLHIDALAGSRSRGKTTLEDQVLAQDLLHAEKDAMEHDIVKRQILEVLNPFSKQFGYPASPLLKTLPNVQHLHTPIEAELEQSTSVFELIEQLHPTPAVGGYPKRDALGVIEQIEPQNRGWYAGIVGWVSEQGDADMAVSIRSASHMKDKLTVYAGCGLVEGSIPEQEWEETYVKLAPFIEAAQDVAHA